MYRQQPDMKARGPTVCRMDMVPKHMQMEVSSVEFIHEYNCSIYCSILGSYQGQWLRGMRHGYGVRTSAPFGMAARFRTKSIRASMTSLRSNEGGNNQAPTPDPVEKRSHRIDDARGGFVLKAKSDEPPARRNSLVEKTKKGLLSVSTWQSKPTVIVLKTL